MGFSVLKRITGMDLLQDLSEFFQAFSGMVGGFRERAKRVNELLADEQTSFLVVCGPQGEPIDEAVYFHRKLVEAKLPFGGVIVEPGPLRPSEPPRPTATSRAELEPPSSATTDLARARRRRTSPTTARSPTRDRRNVRAPRQRDAAPAR